MCCVFGLVVDVVFADVVCFCCCFCNGFRSCGFIVALLLMFLWLFVLFVMVFVDLVIAL